ncbi:unnamed protein product, partial [Mesorhabditis spiculigera]
MFLLLGCILFSAFIQISCGADNVPHFMNDSALVRVKRQTFYYLCGSPPTQYYSVKPCTPTAPKCQNGGRLIGVGCRSSVDCTPYHTGISQCIQSCCCTVPEPPLPPPLPPVPGHRFGVCYHGQLSEVRCNEPGQCAPGQTCINGLCCTSTGNEYKHACGGEAALGSCTAGTCPAGESCTSSNYCCECPVGISPGKCGPNGSCPGGYTCHLETGFCCAHCPGHKKLHK